MADLHDGSFLFFFMCDVSRRGGIRRVGAPQDKCRDLPMSGDASDGDIDRGYALDLSLLVV